MKVFSAFSEFEARWTHPDVHVTRQETKAATDGVGTFEGRSLYQILVAYEPKKRHRA